MRNQKTDRYREFLIKSLIELEEARDNLNLIAFNLAMCGEWKEIDELFAEGDTLFTTYEDFRALADVNVKQLVAVIDGLSDAFESIRNTNVITRKEIDRFIADSNDSLPF